MPLVATSSNKDGAALFRSLHAHIPMHLISMSFLHCSYTWCKTAIDIAICTMALYTVNTYAGAGPHTKEESTGKALQVYRH